MDLNNDLSDKQILQKTYCEVDNSLDRRMKSIFFKLNFYKTYSHPKCNCGEEWQGHFIKTILEKLKEAKNETFIGKNCN